MPRQTAIQRELSKRLTWFIFQLNPEQRKKSVLGEPELCEEGKKLFALYCEVPINESSFLVHSRRVGGCRKCHTAFLEHLRLLTDKI